MNDSTNTITYAINSVTTNKRISMKLVEKLQSKVMLKYYLKIGFSKINDCRIVFRNIG